MRHLRLAVLAALAVALCSAPFAVAHDHKGGGAVVVPASDELLGEAWVQLLSEPNGTFSGSCFPVGHRGRVVAPEPSPDFTASCTVKRGTRLFFYFGSDCSNVEEPPFFGADEAAQAACAKAIDEEFFVEARLTVDDGEPVDIRTPRFELLSPQRTVELPEDNFLGAPAGPATFVAHGWGALVKKLRPGEHTITVEVADSEGGAQTFTATINVVRYGHYRDD